MTDAARRGAEAEVRALVPDVETLAAALDAVDYLTDPGLATALFLAVRLPQPLLLEGEPGVGKTEAAKALARVLDTPLYRLQCYEGIDAAEALYEWNHPRQLLGIRLAEARGDPLAEDDLFGRDYLLRRPLLQAIEHPGPRPAVLLLDEIDRADDEFEAFTFEVLAEAAVTIPELGTVRATHPPVVVLTSNRTRDLHDALDAALPVPLDRLPATGAGRRDRPPPGARQRRAAGGGGDGGGRPAALAGLVEAAGIAEAIDWVAALSLLGAHRLDAGGGRGHAGVRCSRTATTRSLPGPRVTGWLGRWLTHPDLARRLSAAEVAVRLADGLHRAGLPVTPRAGRPARLGAAAAATGQTATALYWTCRVTLVTDRGAAAAASTRVFSAVFDGHARPGRQPRRPDRARHRCRPGRRPGRRGRSRASRRHRPAASRPGRVRREPSRTTTAEDERRAVLAASSPEERLRDVAFADHRAGRASLPCASWSAGSC